jgi:acetate---CoA ligase (ADP-forming) subunit beta
MSDAAPIPLVTLSEHESKRVLEGFGLIVAPERLVATPDEAAEAATAVGFPVVLKACGRRITHKTERSLVRLGLHDAAAVRLAGADLLSLVTADDGVVDLLVSAMVPSQRELIVGMATDPTFGRVVMLGVGGVLAEVVADVVFRLLPMTIDDAHEMIDDLALQSLLREFRGEPAVDRGALARALMAVVGCATADPAIEAIDVNPLLVADGIPVAVDALVVTR